MNNQKTVKSRGVSFVSFIINRMEGNTGIAANLRRADNPSTEYQSWEHLAAFNIELDKAYKRLPFTTIAAAISRGKVKDNGSVGIGEALASCYPDGNNSDQAKAKLRRLLACDSLEEVCRILRPIFGLITAKSSLTLDFARLLDELLKFYWNKQWTKSSWAQNFYSSKSKIEDKK